MNNPSATYRIQFHKDFNFKSLEKIIPYLIEIGIDTIYASPIFEAVPGSTHGYDIVNPHLINPEIGTEEELLAISSKLKKAGIKWLQDILPNHMAFHPKNMWLMDVLKKGKSSEFFNFFDIHLPADEKLMVPFLSEDMSEAIENGTLQINKISGQYYLRYAENNWPVCAASNKKLSERKLEEINTNIKLINEIADEQNYRLCNWKETDTLINYRRFFTVNSLICLNIQHKKVFDIYHNYILKLIKKGIFQGLRIDHIDGLFDPKEYLGQLRNKAGQDIYIVVEKILESDEQMPKNWNTEGNTGYDFLAIMNNLFTNRAAEIEFNKLYKKVTEKKLNPQELIYEKKKAILFNHMQGELDNLVALFNESNFLPKKKLNAINREVIKSSLGEMMVQMPVYRYYNYNFPLNGEPLSNVKLLLNRVLDKTELNSGGKLLWQVFIDQPNDKNERFNQLLTYFFQRCMQFTGPLMAKGVEDTAMFTYNRFIGHTEVGDAPDAFGISKDQFHQKMIERQQFWPLSLNASTTHDTKKGEDVRARLNVLTDIPTEWKDVVAKLISITSNLKLKDKSFAWLHNNDVYLIFQTILGTIAMPGEGEGHLQDRLELYIEKALREAKKRSDWAEPNEEYEIIVKDFVKELLNPKTKSYQAIKKFSVKIVDFGIINSLAQVLLKFTCPGIPDIYQGAEMWDLSLVDPDNRRAVDYLKREEYLSTLKNEKSLKKIWKERYSGKTKLWLTHNLLRIRKNYIAVFEKGKYIPLNVKGTYSSNVCAYIRKYEDKILLIAVPLGMAGIVKKETPAEFDWLDTQIILPQGFPMAWKNLLSEKEGVKDVLNDGILINQIFEEIQIGILELKKHSTNRSAGILMHITSLPSDFGIGDFGEEAYNFVDFLKQAGQKYWQILPLNPTKAENGHSPYSSNSAMAGNYLLVNPDGLLKDGLLSHTDFEKFKIKSTDRIDFNKVEKIKAKLLFKAYTNFLKNKNQVLKDEYLAFCAKEKYWLNDFALYTAIKKFHNNLEWYNWPTDFKTRTQKTISNFIDTQNKAMDEIKWQQFIFYRQWHSLKYYANKNSVKFIGDLPFYLDHDSVEVWSKPELFSLDTALNLKTVAGVPPDYFNSQGQFWGMPVYNWANMQKDNYDWWMKRLKKNVELFDLIRLDHFRAFSSYWEIPAENKNAVNGYWMKGVGQNFFKEVKKQLKTLPFIAEDLGEITLDVEKLRDRFGLPGMKVLQFAFGDDMLISPHIPFRYNTPNTVVYSGTHDNNTILGWFNTEIDKQTKARIALYAGVPVSKKNISQVILKLVYSSNAVIAIVPIQDILGLDENSRMNIPGNANGNWNWRMDPKLLQPKIIKYLVQQGTVYGRNG